MKNPKEACSQHEYENAPRSQYQGGDKPGGGKYAIKVRIVNGTAYKEETPLEVVQALEAARQSDCPVILDFGYTPWQWLQKDHPPGLVGCSHGEDDYASTNGRVGRSGGSIKIPIIVAPENEAQGTDGFGGPAISDDSLVSIVKAHNGEVIWQHPSYKPWVKRMEELWNKLSAAGRLNITPYWITADISRRTWAKIGEPNRKAIADYNRGGEVHNIEYGSKAMSGSRQWASEWSLRKRKLVTVHFKYDDESEEVFTMHANNGVFDQSLVIHDKPAELIKGIDLQELPAKFRDRIEAETP